MKKNQDLRNQIQGSGVFMYEVAEMLGVHEGTLSRMLRKDLTPRERARIIAALEEVKKTKAGIHEL